MDSESLISAPVVRSSVDRWREFAGRARRESCFFDGDGPITCARAPGRLDVLGGVADYSGGTVLEATLAEATFAAIQGRADGDLRIRSLGASAAGLAEDVSIPLDRLIRNGRAVPVSEASAALNESPEARWVAYVAGCLYVLVDEGILRPGDRTPRTEYRSPNTEYRSPNTEHRSPNTEHRSPKTEHRSPPAGLNILLDSDVPIGAGVSSSAALEVATMTAMCAHFGLKIDGLEIARLCQVVENRVAGAPCGVMDQVTSALGRRGHILVLSCQPYEVLSHIAIPGAWRFVALDSGVKHSVGGRNYTRARVAAFMGLKILQEQTGRSFGGYLCNLAADEWTKRLGGRVPESLSGARFTEQFGGLPDSATSVDTDETYSVRACAEHPILEQARVERFIRLLRAARDEPDPLFLSQAGRLMIEAHRSYSQRLDLGSPETDLLVSLAMDRGPKQGIYGAKITGGGSGGTVVILCSGDESGPAIEEVRAEYERETGILPRMMTGSSPGALEFGTRSVEV